VGVGNPLGIEPATRLDELDSLRGLAALTVVLYHLKLLWLDETIPAALTRQRGIIDFLLMPVTAGHEAVILFFILSGFVLAIPAVKLHPQRYSVFLIRRLCRIYLPYGLVLVLSVLGSNFFHGDPTQSKSFADFWTAPVDWHLFKQHLIFLGVYDTERFNPPIWSLVFEMRISLIFPLLCAIAMKMRPNHSLVMAVSFSGISSIANKLVHSDVVNQLIFDTLHFAALFVIGIYLARQGVRITSIFDCLSRSKKIVFATLSALLFIYGRVEWMKLASWLTNSDLGKSADLLTATGAAGLMILSLNVEWCRRALLWAPVHSLGKMSYSIYLLHSAVIFILIHLLYGRLPLLIIFPICLAIVIPASWVFYRCVEVPSIDMGRKLSEYFQRTAPVSPSRTS
jgi:peptidoglycan/LPS O-acetylase OafA/YrhL